MQYKPKKTVAEEVEVIELNPTEFQSIKDFYKISLLESGVPVPIVRDTNLKKLILTDGIYRKEFYIRVVEADVDREAEAQARHSYLLNQLDKKADEATLKYNEILSNS